MRRFCAKTDGRGNRTAPSEKPCTSPEILDFCHNDGLTKAITGGALMKPSSGALALFSLALSLTLHAQVAATSSPSAAQQASVAAASSNTVGLSDIRIVRLSQVRGKVEIDRHIGRGYEDGFVNVPITGGTRLRTEVGLAEVEFEDNSTLRLTPDTEVDFTLLKRNAAGSTISSMNVLRGMVYASLANTKGNTFTIAAGDASVQLNPASHVRLTVDGPNSNVAVLSGTVEFTDGSSTTVLTHNRAFAFDLSGSNPLTPVKLESSAFDEWDKNGTDYQKQYSSLRSSAGTGMLYGTSDLGYYGGFVNMPGCGNLWQPYFVSSAWTPYDNGAWAYYPNAGYSWVSSYPWGWLPFHSGTWMSCGAAGWGWMPGGQWMGLQNVAAVSGAAGLGGTRSVPVVPQPSRSGALAIVPVNAHPLAVSSVSAPGTFTFRKDSAGLGVPRDAFGELKPISSEVMHHGQVSTEVERSFIGPSPSLANGNRGASGREISASRSVSTFARPGNDGRMDGMSPTAGSPDFARNSMRSPEPASSPLPRRAEEATVQGSSSPSSPGNTGASRK
jgi:FecR protein